MNTKYHFVCDAANISTAGNLNVLGIFENLNVQQFPVCPKFTFVAGIEGRISEAGNHPFKLCFIDDDGRELKPPVEGMLMTDQQHPNVNFMFTINDVVFPTPGSYVVDLIVDNKSIASETIKLIQV